MRGFLDRFKYHGLFIKLFMVTLVSIITVALLTSLVTIQMSEKLFMNTFSITNSKIISQIKANFESFNYSIVTASNNVQQNGTIKGFLTNPDLNSTTSLKSYYQASQQMERIQSNVAAYPVMMTITGVNRKSHSNDSTYWPNSLEKLRNSMLTVNTLVEPKRLLYQLDKENISGLDKDPVIVASRALMERTSGNQYGILYFAIKESDFKRFYASFTSGGNDVAILDQSGIIVSSNRQELIGKENLDLLSHAQEMEQKGLTFKDVNVLGENSLVLSEYLPVYDFYLVNLINKKEVLSEMVDFKTVALICVGIVLVALIIVFLISRRLTKSLTLLARQMPRIAENNFDNYITVSGSYEIKELGKAYNYMLDELNEYVRKLIQTQKDQRNAELSALQMQINPHFLYNTLASVKILVQQGNKEKAAATINSLISLLQNTVGNISETISVAQELVNLKNYVFINHVRYGDQIAVNYFIADDCYGYHIPKLIIQPFIENAFFHAFQERKDGHIYVLFSREDETLVCEVVDNGVGMEGYDHENPDHSAISTSHFFSGIGIRNVHDRISLLYGEEYGVEIVSNIGEGTRVKIKLPLHKT
ncbi:two-component system sensor histidine kinase YesM [Paenibacillus endophyticus]|uniref:Two-component system sensor histidine kinase YesM n=1 Tax=Paenibacillus endophyticus TaxID=1294268 RepID=A0A7W5GAU0_9BACL|nr:sensor histidine kinase [Paenibacillus endophyticus]MBB3153131.1 two-component system sensor histidine kinase YesM [Paenibacillus endophyticus]